jgi:hypothetical protein
MHARSHGALRVTDVSPCDAQHQGCDKKAFSQKLKMSQEDSRQTAHAITLSIVTGVALILA